jgi:hypothetical protein
MQVGDQQRPARRPEQGTATQSKEITVCERKGNHAIGYVAMVALVQRPSHTLTGARIKGLAQSRHERKARRPS